MRCVLGRRCWEPWRGCVCRVLAGAELGAREGSWAEPRGMGLAELGSGGRPGGKAQVEMRGEMGLGRGDRMRQRQDGCSGSEQNGSYW